MKFKLLSDLHLEFYNRRPFYRDAIPQWEPTPTEEDKDTTLLLAGDIHVGKDALPWIVKMCDRFAHVIYILGNHEFYHHEWFDIKNYWANKKIWPNNFTFLDNDTITLGDVRIIGGTLWTDVNDPFNMWQGPLRMADYKVILKCKVPGFVEKLTVYNTTEAHNETIKYFEKILQLPWEGKTIVMTHHLPHPKCVHPRFEGSNLNAFFMTDLDHIFERYNINVWCHGHTHDCVDTEVHGTRILCNPMGYHGVQLNQDFKENLIFEL